jgi:hypothetical protein
MKKLIVLTASRMLRGRNPMKITRRFALTALLCLGATLCTTAPAHAQAGFVYPLSCVVGVEDLDYGASGQYSFSGIQTMSGWDQNGGWTSYEGTLFLRCRDLIPRAVYSVDGKKSRCDGNGNLEIQWPRVTMVYYRPAYSPSGYWRFYPSPVYRLISNKTSILVLK